MTASKLSLRTWKLSVWRTLLLMTASACLTACSNGSANPLDGLKALGPAALAPEPKKELPEVQQPVKDCIKKALPAAKSSQKGKPPSANDKTINMMAWGKEKQECGEQLIQWYDDVRRVNGTPVPIPERAGRPLDGPPAM